MIYDFLGKLGVALHYYHTNRIFEGKLIPVHIDKKHVIEESEFIAKALAICPIIPEIQRGKTSLRNQFNYRYGIDEDIGIMK